MSFLAVVAVESIKVRALPSVGLAITATVLAGAAVGAVLAASAVDHQIGGSAVEVAVRAVPYVQAGVVLIGILPVSHEYAGHQMRVTLAAMPRRGLLLLGKAFATALALALTSLLTVTVTWSAAAITLLPFEGGADEANPDVWQVVGAAAYLSIIGLLAHAVAVLVRHLMPALVAVLSIVLIASPLVARVTEHARWLPDRAASQLYDPADPVLTAGTGALVALAWTAAIGSLGVVRFVRGDA